MKCNKFQKETSRENKSELQLALLIRIDAREIGSYSSGLLALLAA